MSTGSNAPSAVNRAQLSCVEEVHALDDTEREHGDQLLRPEGVDEDFAATYTVHYPRLVRALELGGVDRPGAEDIAQEAFARALGRWRWVRRGANPAGYVYRSAFRLSWRSSAHKRLFAEAHSTPDIATEATLLVGIEAALAKMPLARRRCAVLCLVVGMSTRDAAGALHIAESTVRKQIERARTDLTEALADSDTPSTA